MSAITDINGIGPVLATAFADKGFTTIEKIATATPEALATVPGISQMRGRAMIDLAKLLLKADGDLKARPTSAPKASKNPLPNPTSPKAKKDKSMTKKDEKKKSTKKDEKEKSKKKNDKVKKDTKKKKNGKKKKDNKKKSGKKKK